MTIGPGTLVNGKYRLGRQLGEGGMGAIYEARHEFLGTEVALKFLHPALSSRPNVVARFVQEARVSANIKSPHVVSVVDVDQSPEGLAFLVMELLHGEPLSSRLAREPILSVALSCQITVQCLLALDAAHALGVVHRDMKPENVFLTQAPGDPAATSSGLLVKILDFGIAKLRTLGEVKSQLTRPGMVMGTPEYMAPEQVFHADSVDARADLYALGAMAFEMMAGQRPVQGEDARVIAAAVMSGKTPRLDAIAPEVPREIADVVAIALAPKPTDRFSSALAMLRAFVNGAKDANVPIEAPPLDKLRTRAKSQGNLPAVGAMALGAPSPSPLVGSVEAAPLPRADGPLQPIGDRANGQKHEEPAAKIPETNPSPLQQPRIETGTVAITPESGAGQDRTAFGAPTPYAPPVAPVAREGYAGQTDAGMVSPYANDGAWNAPKIAPIPTTPSQAGDYPSRRGEARSPWLAIALAALVIGAIVAIVIVLLPSSSAPPPPPPVANQGDDDEPAPTKKKHHEAVSTNAPIETTPTTTATPTPTKPIYYPPTPKPTTSTKPSTSTSTSTSTTTVPSVSTTTKPTPSTTDTISLPPFPFPLPTIP